MADDELDQAVFFWTTSTCSTDGHLVPTFSTGTPWLTWDILEWSLTASWLWLHYYFCYSSWQELHTFLAHDDWSPLFMTTQVFVFCWAWCFFFFSWKKCFVSCFSYFLIHSPLFPVENPVPVVSMVGSSNDHFCITKRYLVFGTPTFPVYKHGHLAMIHRFKSQPIQIAVYVYYFRIYSWRAPFWNKVIIHCSHKAEFQTVRQTRCLKGGWALPEAGEARENDAQRFWKKGSVLALSIFIGLSFCCRLRLICCERRSPFQDAPQSRASLHAVWE